MDLISDAVSVVALVRLHDGVEAPLGVFGVENLRIAAAGRNRRGIAHEQHLGGVIAPQHDIGIDAPVVGAFAHCGENLRGVEGSAGRVVGCAHASGLIVVW